MTGVISLSSRTLCRLSVPLELHSPRKPLPAAWQTQKRKTDLASCPLTGGKGGCDGELTAAVGSASMAKVMSHLAATAAGVGA